MSLENFYQLGIKLFEIGDYKGAIAQLEKAQNLAADETFTAGEIQIWIANAYDTIGETDQAIAICQKLLSHDNAEVRKLAAYVLGIFSAPPLNKLEGITSEMPNLSNLDGFQMSAGTYTATSSKVPTGSNQSLKPNTTSPKLGKPQNNPFIWIALAIACMGILTVLYADRL